MSTIELDYKKNHVSTVMNILGVMGICVALLVAFFYQFARNELPCPLCLLQRVGLMITGVGFLFNIFLGRRKTHYAMALVGCIVTAIIASRQVFLHILPGDTGYGSAFLGIHFYTWSLLASVIFVVAIALMLVLEEHVSVQLTRFPILFLRKAVAVIFIVLVAANLVSTLLECGGGQCADNPVHYLLLDK